MKAHGKYLRLINLKLDGKLAKDKLDILDAHLHECKACHEEYEHLRTIRGNLLASPEMPADPVTTERRTAAIMAAVKKRASSKRSLYWQFALRPALVLGSLLIILMISFAVVHENEPTGPTLFSNPQDILIDSILVDTLNDHEVAGLFDAYYEPVEVVAETKVNSGFVEERIK